MAITKDDLQQEREVLKKDFELLNSRITQTEKDLGTMKSNLNAVFGAIQQVDKLLAKVAPEEQEKQLLTEKQKSMPEDKKQALNIATS